MIRGDEAIGHRVCWLPDETLFSWCSRYHQLAGNGLASVTECLSVARLGSATARCTRQRWSQRHCSRARHDRRRLRSSVREEPKPTLQVPNRDAVDED